MPVVRPDKNQDWMLIHRNMGQILFGVFAVRDASRQREA